MTTECSYHVRISCITLASVETNFGVKLYGHEHSTLSLRLWKCTQIIVANEAQRKLCFSDYLPISGDKVNERVC